MERSRLFNRKLAGYGSWLMGAVLLFAAFAKVLDLPSFIRQVSAYQILPAGWENPAALLLIALEGCLGLLCLAATRVRLPLAAALGLICVFTAATLLRWDLLQGTDCNCFGPVLSSGPPGLVWRNGVLIVLAGASLLAAGASPKRAARPWLRAAGGLGAVLAALLFLNPAPSHPDLHRDARTEDHVRIFVSATCSTCQEKGGEIARILDQYRLTPVRFFISANHQQEIEDFLEAANLPGGYIPLTYSQISKEVRGVPCTQVIHRGRVAKQWLGTMPEVEELVRTVRNLKAGKARADASP